MWMAPAGAYRANGAEPLNRSSRAGADATDVTADGEDRTPGAPATANTATRATPAATGNLRISGLSIARVKDALNVSNLDIQFSVSSLQFRKPRREPTATTDHRQLKTDNLSPQGIAVPQ